MAQKLRVAIALASLIVPTAWADMPSASAIVTPPQPQWTELTVEQRVILAPLADEWDALEFNRRKKWLGITRLFSTLTPEEQRRIQVQMQEWAKLSPEQRRQAREHFLTTNKLPAEKKQELKQKWEEYSNLPEEEKERLKQQAAAKPLPKPGWAPIGAPAPTAKPPGTGAAEPAPVAAPQPAAEAVTPVNAASPPAPSGEAETRR